MSPSVMSEYAPHSRFLGIAELPGHRLMFNRRSVRTGTGVADVVPAEGSSVWGALYELNDADLSAIDRKEGYDRAYTRQPLPVRLCEDGSEHLALTYTVRDKEPVEVPPSPEYLEGLLQAAGELELPASYIEFLDGLRERFAEVTS
jgi:gamma-glutamylcyclotransferase